MRKMDVILFGAGLVGRQVVPVYKDKVNIVCFADNDPKKKGKMVQGIKVISPDDICNTTHDYVVISSTSIGQIMDQLLTMGIPRERIKVMREAESGDKRHFPWDAMLFLLLTAGLFIGGVIWIILHLWN